MKYGILLISLIVPFLTGCEDKVPDAREFPIIRTLTVTEADSSGATFNGELIKKGNAPVTSYGFVWSLGEPDIENSSKVILGEDINSIMFETRINHSLIKGLDYNIRVFATFGDRIVYGNIIRFRSKGSSLCPWSLEIEGYKCGNEGWFYGCADSEFGYIIPEYTNLCVFDPINNSISRSVNYFGSGKSGNLFCSITSGKTLYLFSDGSNILYKHENGIWSEQSVLPFYWGGGSYCYHGYSSSDNLYILGQGDSYKYNVRTDTWQKINGYPINWMGHSIGGTDLLNKAYLILDDYNIQEYNVEEDSWNLKTQFPGVLKDYIVSFSYNNKIYFGLSTSDYYDDTYWMDKKIWEYDPASDNWKIVAEFPVNLLLGDIFFFSIKGNLYICYAEGIPFLARKFSIWKFDPSKI